MRKFFTALLMAIFVAFALLGVRQVQQAKLEDAQGQQGVLKQQIADAQDKLAAAKAAGDVKTDGWSEYCDPQAGLCLKYPKEWTLDGGTPDQSKQVSATITNPSKTLSVGYMNPLAKDNGSGSMHIVKKESLSVKGTSLAVIGSYPVAFGAYQPGWKIAGIDEAEALTVGKVANTQVANPMFALLPGQSTSVTAKGPTFDSAAKAEAWFDSIDGKTLQAVLASLRSK